MERLGELVGGRLEVWYEPRARGGSGLGCVITAVVGGRRYHLYRAASINEAARATWYAAAVVDLVLRRAAAGGGEPVAEAGAGYEPWPGAEASEAGDRSE